MGQRLLVISPDSERGGSPRAGGAGRGRSDAPAGPVAARRRPFHGRHVRDRGAARAGVPVHQSSEGAEHPPLLNPRDRLASAAAPRTFNSGLHSVDWRGFTHISKLDGDMELPPDYFERMLGEFEADEQLGMAGGLRARAGTREVAPGASPDRASRQRSPEVLLARLLRGHRGRPGAARMGHDRRDARSHARASNPYLRAAGRRSTIGPGQVPTEPSEAARARRSRLHRCTSPSTGSRSGP